MPPPFFAALHAMHEPLHSVSQQTPSTHEPLAQSVLPAQAVPAGQPVGQGPQQSTPTSPLSLIMSVQLPVHAGHLAPPQSIAVSVPSFVPLMQVISGQKSQVGHDLQRHSARVRYAATPVA